MTQPTDNPDLADRLAAFGRHSFFAGAIFFSVASTTARFLGWGALLAGPASFAGGWLACRVIDRLAARAAEQTGAVAGAAPTQPTRED